MKKKALLDSRAFCRQPVLSQKLTLGVRGSKPKA